MSTKVMVYDGVEYPDFRVTENGQVLELDKGKLKQMQLAIVNEVVSVGIRAKILDSAMNRGNVYLPLAKIVAESCELPKGSRKSSSKPYVINKDGNLYDCSVDNIKWVDIYDYLNHCVKHKVKVQLVVEDYLALKEEVKKYNNKETNSQENILHYLKDKTRDYILEVYASIESSETNSDISVE